MKTFLSIKRSKLGLSLFTLVVSVLTGCGLLKSPFPPDATPIPATPPHLPTPPTPPIPPTPPVPAIVAPPAHVPEPTDTISTTATGTRTSSANTAKDYRKDAAAHLYALNPSRIYKGKLPPLLYAIGVVEVDLDAQGKVSKINWKRTPSQVPEVISEIERLVHAAAPYPLPLKLGKVTYTDVWLWDESGQFQLDTLTEGQL